MAEIAESAAAGTALVVCKDRQVCRWIIEALEALAIFPESCEDFIAVTDRLNRRKFEAVIVDLGLGDEALLVMKQIHLSRTNRTAVSFAITAGDTAQTSGAKPDATFVLQRPLSAASISQTLRAAYGLIVRERRRYFRCPIAVPIFVRSRQPEEVPCQTVNVSEGGIAISAPASLILSGPAAVRFSLPGHASQLFAETKMCWHGEGGLVGLEFQAVAPSQRSELQEWLARKLDETLPQQVAELFRTASRP